MGGEQDELDSDDVMVRDEPVDSVPVSAVGSVSKPRDMLAQ